MREGGMRLGSQRSDRHTPSLFFINGNGHQTYIHKHHAYNLQHSLHNVTNAHKKTG